MVLLRVQALAAAGTGELELVAREADEQGLVGVRHGGGVLVAGTARLAVLRLDGRLREVVAWK